MKSLKFALAFLIPAACALQASAADKVRIVNEGGIRDEWTLAPGAKLAAPGYPAAFANRGDNVCMAMGYRINPDGGTGEFAVLKAWSSSMGESEPVDGYWDAFSQASVAALHEWRFMPKADVGKPRPVDTVATMTFMGRNPEDAANLRSKCKIDDLAAFLEQVRVEMAKRSDMNRRELEKVYQQRAQAQMQANRARSGAVTTP